MLHSSSQYTAGTAFKVPVSVVRDALMTCVFTHWVQHWPQGTGWVEDRVGRPSGPNLALLDSAL